MASCVTFEAANPQPQDIAVQLKAAIDRVDRVAGGLLMLCGGPALQVADIARAVAGVTATPIVIVCGTGVLTERGEHDNVSMSVGLLWNGGSCRPFSFDVGPEPDGRAVGERVLTEIRAAMDGSPGAVALFAQPEAFPTSTMSTVDIGSACRVRLFGGGVAGRPGAWIAQGGEAHAADVVGLAIRGISPPVVRASVGCRVLGELQAVTQAEGGLILRIGERSAIEALKLQASRSHGRDLLVVAFEIGRDESGDHPRLMVRGIRGIHEPRGGLMVSEDVRVGTRVAFAVRDPSTSRADLETRLREMAREMAGGIARFGVYVDCAGRGQEMYGSSGVDVGLIRTRWPSMPLIGLKSSFEIGPGLGGSAIHLYAGVLSVFCSPS
jgi:small ligand-binding sensory domain FIST